MSDSWICWNPRIEEPSNIRPSVNTFPSKDSTGTVKCCTVPGRSQNLTSTNSTLLSPMNFRTSSAFVNINPPWRLRPCPDRAGLRLLQDRGCHARRLPFPSGVPSVSRVLRVAFDQVTLSKRDSRTSPCTQAIPWSRVSFPGGRSQGPQRPSRVSRPEVRAARGRAALGGRHGAPGGRADDRLGGLHADRGGVVP